jgi:hypothetical protein
MASQDATVEPKIKGLAFIEVLRWYSRTYGQGRLREAIAALPPALKVHITDPDKETFGLKGGTWYPTALIESFFDHMTRDLPPAAVRKLAEDAVKASVGVTMSGIYGTILRVLVTPKMVADHYQKLWRLYHTTGVCRVEILGPTHHEMRLSDWPDHGSFICLMNAFATRLILETIGCKEVEVTREKCIDHGDPYCAYAQRWRA